MDDQNGIRTGKLFSILMNLHKQTNYVDRVNLVVVETTLSTNSIVFILTWAPCRVARPTPR